MIGLSRQWAEITGIDAGTDADTDADAISDSDFDSDTDMGPVSGCPISFSAEEVRECLELNVAQGEADEQLQECLDIVGVASEGWTPVASYDRAKARAEKFKMEAFQAAESGEERRRLEENWIFDDFDEDDYT